MRGRCSRPRKRSGRPRCGASTGTSRTAAWSSWNAAIRNFAIVPCHQPAHVRGKNAADIALAIDAVDLTYRERLDGFLLVSSDSDFTRLAQRLREGGFAVFGFGESKAPRAFRSACHRFQIVGRAATRTAAAPGRGA